MKLKECAETLRVLSSMLANRQPDWRQFLDQETDCRLVTFCNPFSLKQFIDDPRYRRDIQSFDLIFADGILLSSSASWITGNTVPRLAFDGNSIALQVLRDAAGLSKRIGLVGGEPGEPEAAAERLCEIGLPVSFYHHGFLDAQERDEVLQNIRSKVDVLVIGMGAPLQEAFLTDLRQSGWTGTGFTCGAYISQVAARGVKYYPESVNRFHLRMFFRLMHEPGKLLWRYSIGYLPFYKAMLHLLIAGRR